MLELGPGPGYFTTSAAARTGREGAVVCLDIQPEMLRKLRAGLRAADTASVRLVAGDIARLPFRDATFDSAYMVAVLGEVPDRLAALREVRRVLRPGGIIGFCETLTDPDYVTQGELRRMCLQAGLTYESRERQLLGYIMRFTRPA